jgi:hypothetical protein
VRSYAKRKSRCLSLAGAFALVACGSDSSGSSGSSAGALGDPATLSGQIANFAMFGGSSKTVQATVGTSRTVLATGSVDATGTFTIALPSRSALAPSLMPQHMDGTALVPMGCTGSVAFSPPDFAMLPLQLTVPGSSTFTGILAQSNVGAAQSNPATDVTYFYYDRDVTQTGSFDCNGTPMSSRIHAVYDNHWKTGWNRLVHSLDTSPSPMLEQFSTGAAPDGVSWQL